MKKYSKKLKEKIIARMLPPANAYIPDLAKETGIPINTLYSWRIKNRNVISYTENKHGTEDTLSSGDKPARPSSGHQPEISAKSKADVVGNPVEHTVIPYDENLLGRARTQWQFGDWHSLAQLDQETMQHHPDRAKLALLVSAGLLQIGNNVKARQFVCLAQKWGVSKKLIFQVLAAGIHNSLGRASILVGHQKRALKHFESSIAVADPGADIRLLTQARISQQCFKLGFAQQQQQPDTLSSISSPVLTFSPAQRGIHIVQLAKYELGKAWAGNTINTVTFRHHGILTHQGKQITAFYVDEHTLRLVQRDLDKSSIQNYDIHGEYNLRDAHNSISLGVDRAGHLHISYDHHATQLRYRRSIRPNDITAWTDEHPMTGKAEDKVTYPSFILPHHGFPLTLLYRDGVHNKGNAYMKTYDENTQSWTNHSKSIFCGSGSKPWTSNVYWNYPAIGSDGSLHLSFFWRTDMLGKDDLVNNINICYAYSQDNGISWLTSNGQYCQLPITQVNSEIVHPVSPGSNLINQCSIALDSRNRPHIVFYADDSNGIPQYQHLRYDGKQWHHQVISQLTQSSDLQVPISRPEIVLDRQDNAYIITRGDNSQMVATFLAAPNYMWSLENTLTLWDENLVLAEPVIDRVRWKQDNVLSLLLQQNEQSNYEIDHRLIQHPIILIDIQFNFSP